MSTGLFAPAMKLMSTAGCGPSSENKPAPNAAQEKSAKRAWVVDVKADPDLPVTKDPK